MINGGYIGEGLDEMYRCLVIWNNSNGTYDLCTYPVSSATKESAIESAATYVGDDVCAYDKFGNYYPIKK